MRIRFRKFYLGLVFAGAGLMLAGCNLSQFSAPSTASSVLPAISGKVHGGQQPISGASIYLYAANTTVGKGQSTPLLSSPVLTNANGGFSIGAGAYTCPTPGALVYLVATGGNPGLPGNVNNTAIGLMVALGTCSSLSTDAFVTVNELTTVASVEALAPFMADAAHVGSDAGNPGGLAGAFATAAAMVNFATGQIQTAAGVTQPVALLNTLADILAACVNSAGRSLNHSAPCEVLRSYAGLGGAPDTLTAMLLIVQYPSQNVAQLFALVGAAVPFAPTLAIAPATWGVALGFALPPPTGGAANPGYRLAIDTSQHIWVYSQDAVIDPITGVGRYTGTISIYDNNGLLLHTITSGTGGLGAVAHLSPDSLGDMWVLGTSSPSQLPTVLKFDSTGLPLTPAGGIAVPYTPTGSLGTAIPEFPLGWTTIAADTSGNLWGIGSGMTNNCILEVNSTGSVITPNGSFCSNASNVITYSLATDGVGNVWAVGSNSVAKSNSAGNFITTGVSRHGCFTADLSTEASTQFSTYYLTYDRVQHQLWGAAGLGLGALRDDGSEVFCFSNGSAYGLAPFTVTTTISGSGSSTVSNYNLISSLATDGAGNLWFTNTHYHYVVTSSGGVVTSTVAPYTSLLQQIAPDGSTLVSPLPGIIPGATGQDSLAIDAFGNMWIIDQLNQKLLKQVGLAVPKNYQ